MQNLQNEQRNNEQNHQTVQQDQNCLNQTQLDKFIDVLCKPIQQRTKKQVMALLQFVNHNQGLRVLAEKVSLKFVKHLLSKFAVLNCVQPNKVLASQGDRINYLYIPISGKVVSTKKNIRNNSLQQYNQYQRLGIIADNYVKESNKFRGKNNKQVNLQEIKTQKFARQYRGEDLFEAMTVGIQDRSYGTKYLCDYITTQRTTMIQIPISGFLVTMAFNLHEKVKTLYDIIHHYSCFRDIEKETIQRFIMCLAQKKKRRGAYIYRQHQDIESLYLLAHGQIRLTKQSSLFKENPNNLYANRISLLLENNNSPVQLSGIKKSNTNDKPIKAKLNVKSRPKPNYMIKQQQMKKQQAILPYADLSLMFNFQPKKKIIQISKVHAFCIFGSQQFIQNKKRQTNAICNSLDVTYYQISILKIKQILGKNISAFIEGLKLDAKNKVLHRQNHYANTINIQNKANLDYFYYDGQQQKKSAAKLKIFKINSKIRQNNQKQRQKYKQKFRSVDNKNHEALPQYTAFNFHKLQLKSPTNNEKQYDSPMRTLKSSGKNLQFSRHLMISSNFEENQNPENGRKQSQSDDQIQYFRKPNDQELKIINITHTWKVIQNKVDTESIKSQKLSQKRYTITVNQPLIDNSFFTNLDREKKRVERKIRKDKITLGKSRVSAMEQRKIINL